MPTGRPSSYTDEIADEICARLAEGESLRGICSREGFPHRDTVRTWLDKHERFAAQYARARDLQAEYYAERIISVAEGRESPDLNPDDFNNPKLYREKVHENIQRDRLLVDTLKWTASKLAPRRFGDRVGLEHSGPEGGAIKMQWEAEDDGD